MTKFEEICDMILKTESNFKDAQNVGIKVLDKFGDGDDDPLMSKLCEIAFYVQSLARGYQSQYSRANQAWNIITKKGVKK